MPIRALLLAASLMTPFAAHASQSFDVKAGPIWNNNHAREVCPGVCQGLSWNGQWTTTVPGQMSVCGTTVGVDVPVGPIQSNDHAQRICPSKLREVKWNGQWTTTVPGSQSVCGCLAPSTY